MSEQDEAPVTLEIRRGNPTPEELAAVVAVDSDAYAAEVASLEAGEDPRPSAWMQTRRALRRPLNRAVGWGRFSR